MPVKTQLPRTDPRSTAWERAPELVVPLLPQDVTEPRLLKAGTSLLRVRALHDGEGLAFRLEWQDASRDAVVATSRFSDGAAVQVPARAGGDIPSAFMGEAGKPVRIYFWKAAWQEARPDDQVIKSLYPNAAIDHYPFTAADPKRRAGLEAQYSPARAAGNPVTGVASASPVQEVEAEGFGTVTAVRNGRSTGHGEWKQGSWSVVIALPLPRGGALQPGVRSYAAFALWDGGARQVGARKMRSNWVSLVLEAAP